MLSLLELKTYLQNVKTANLWQISQHFAAQPATIQGMLSHWVNKGRVRCDKQTAACGRTCFKCPQATIEVYSWLD